MKHQINKIERNIYIGSIAVGVVGLVFIILGIIADNVNYDNPLNQAQLNFKFRYIGLIIIASAALIAFVTLLIFARNVDKENEKANRRKQRLNALMSDIKKDENTLIVENGVIKEKEVTFDDTSKTEEEKLDNTLDK